MGREQPKKPEPIALPDTICWGGMIDKPLFLRLLGPDKELLIGPGETFQADDTHEPSRCSYGVRGDGVEDILQVNTYWLDKGISRELPPPGAGVNGEDLQLLKIGLRAYYVGEWNRVYFNCDVKHRPGTPKEIRADKHLAVNLYARPTKSARIGPLAARQASVDILTVVARKVAARVGCTNDTKLPAKAPKVTQANWPRFYEHLAARQDKD